MFSWSQYNLHWFPTHCTNHNLSILTISSPYLLVPHLRILGTENVHYFGLIRNMADYLLVNDQDRDIEEALHYKAFIDLLTMRKSLIYHCLFCTASNSSFRRHNNGCSSLSFLHYSLYMHLYYLQMYKWNSLLLITHWYH